MVENNRRLLDILLPRITLLSLYLGVCVCVCETPSALSPPELEEGEHVSQAHTTSVTLQSVCVRVCRTTG